MEAPHTRSASPLNVALAFAAVYLIWGSTYFFIREALDGFPPFVLGGVRFMVASAILFGWCLASGLSIHPRGDLGKCIIVGLLLLFIGNGAVVWVEQTLPSSVVAIVIAVAPLSFVMFDRRNWGVNFRSPATLLGVLAGFAGVLLLFSERIVAQWNATGATAEGTAMLVLLLGIIAWPAGSLFSKYRPASIANQVSSAWQMLAGGIAFLFTATARGEWSTMDWSTIPVHAWWATAYLAVFGSVVAYSAYIWLLQVRPPAQVSTYAYVNPVVAVLLGVYLGNEVLGWREWSGLLVILSGVLLINLAKYRKQVG